MGYPSTLRLAAVSMLIGGGLALGHARWHGKVEKSPPRPDSASVDRVEPDIARPPRVRSVASPSPGGPGASQGALIRYGGSWLSVATLAGQVSVVTWTTPPTVADLGPGREPMIYLDAAGRPTVAYVAGGRLAVDRLEAGAWRYAGALGAVGPGASLPDGCGDRLAWVDSAAQGEPGTLYTARQDPGGAWTVAPVIEAGDIATAPTVDCGPEGWILAWSRRDAVESTVEARRYDLTGIVVESVSVAGYDPSITTCGLGWVAGLHGDDGRGRLLSTRAGGELGSAPGAVVRGAAVACEQGVGLATWGEWPARADLGSDAARSIMLAPLQAVGSIWSIGAAVKVAGPGVGPGSVEIAPDSIAATWRTPDGVYLATWGSP